MQNTPYVIYIYIYLYNIFTYIYALYIYNYIYIIQLYTYPPAIKLGNWIAFKARILAGKLSINWGLPMFHYRRVYIYIHIHYIYGIHIDN